MKKSILILAVILISMNFMSCTPNSVSEGQNPQENATNGNDEKVKETPQ